MKTKRQKQKPEQKVAKLEKELAKKNRQLEIEAALGRVRSLALGMHKSEEVGNVTDKLFEELNTLTLKVIGCTIVVIDKKMDTWETWRARTKVVVKPFEVASLKRSMQVLKKHLPKWFPVFYEALGRREKSLIEEMPKRRRTQLLNSIAEQYNYTEKEKSKLLRITPDKITAHFLFFKLGYLALITEKRLPEENLAVAIRFVEVFDFAYTRFLDIKNAEEQAREAQIEAALERVRSRTMAMQQSNELADTAAVLFKQLIDLGIAPNRLYIGIMKDKSGDVEFWITDEDGSKVSSGFSANLKENRSFKKMLSGWIEQKKSIAIDMKGKELQEYFQHLQKLRVPFKGGLSQKRRVQNIAYFSQGLIGLASPDLQPEETINLLERFAAVFNLTYRRFLDLQKAEEQTREAQIELAMERIRARTMAMHKSEELSETSFVLFQQFVELGIVPNRFFIGSINEKENLFDIWITQWGGEMSSQRFKVNIEEPLQWRKIYKAWEAQDKSLVVDINGEDLIKWNEYLESIGFSVENRKSVTRVVNSFAIFSKGFIAITTPEIISAETIRLLERFAAVFNLTYRRFLDLKMAEAQAREAQLELALERVRASTMAMHNSNDVGNATSVMFTELEKLGIETIRCGIDIMDKSKIMEVWATTSSDKGKVIQIVGKLDSRIHPHLQRAHEAWERQEKFISSELEGQDLKDYYKKLSAAPDYRVPVTKVQTNKQFNYDFFFKEGGLFAYRLKPFTEDEIIILQRFTAVFGLTFRRYLDLKKAEEQAHEAQIEASLEKVRAVAMSMNKSEELLNICKVSFDEFQKLGFKNIRNAIIHIPKDEQKFFMDYDFSELTGGAITKIEYGSHPIVDEYLNKIRSTEDAYFEVVIDKNQLKGWKDFRRKSGQKDDPRLDEATALYYYLFSIGIGDIGISAFKPIDDSQIKILKRFRNVFDLAYRRYNDIALAEEQARETQIQLALERVRARTMAMHKSEELSETSFVLFEQLKELGEVAEQISIMIYNEKEGVIELYATIYGNLWEEIGRLPLEKNFVHKKIYDAWKEKKKSIVVDLSGKELNDFNKFKMKYSTQYKTEDDLPKNRWVVHNAFFSKGVLTFSTHAPRPPETIKILERFAGVFDLTYTRFLDLKKAEAQVREAEIEAALERVRSRTMAMQKSDELADTASHFFEQLNSLGIKSYRFNIAIVDANSEKCQLWSTTNEGKVIPSGPLIPLKEYDVFNQMYDGWKKQESVSVIRVQGDERIEWTKYIMRYVSFNEYKPENIDLEKLRTEPAIFSNFFFKQGFVVVHTIEEIDKSDLKIIQRFVNVFEQTYTRFLDLQKAEAQAREAQIEAALERVRGKAMAMHSSVDFVATIVAFYQELALLSFTPRRCGVGLIDKETRMAELSTLNTTYNGDSIEIIGKIKLEGHPVLEKVYDNWLIQNEYHPILQGDEIKEYYKFIGPQIAIPDYSEDQIQYGYFFYFKEGGVYSWTEKKFSDDELQIYRRFTTVLSLTYRRYMDLKEAEVRAIESIRQASLDRIRAEIASMRTSEDLNRITPIVWRELKNLEVPFFRCGVYIINEPQEKVQVYLTTPDGKSLGVLNLAFDSNEITSNTVEHWQKKQVYRTHWDKEEFIEWTKSMMKLGQIQSAETYQGSTTPPESLHLHFVPFAQGMLYVGDVQPLTDEKLELVKTLAEAFSIAYARYEDFKNLEDAKNKIEITLSELKSAQAQLVHSEKMASLGELTAGIAHEIKNPLNFVNNFSEVSRELLDEMKTEIENKNIDEVIELIQDLKQNLDKINQHGKRADSIVKGMLLHSRGTSGEKTPTDINDLLDQYVNLAYHGMRATNKEFNITIEKDYDKTLEKINVVPQDISRVFLNIINNACYAAYDKKKKDGDGFNPVLKVSTKKLEDKVEIRIADNGNGIPKDILDKIFQPFFTTKPTGEGTGLGLSLSYDIVTKVHGGELRVETKEGVGTEFIIILNK